MRTMGIKDVVRGVYEACIEACGNIGRTVGTLPTCFKGDHALSADPGTRKEIIEEEINAESATDGVSLCSPALSTRRQRLELLRSQCSSELEYNVKKSTEHWTEVPRKFTVDPIFLSANSERFKHLMERWRCPKSEHGFFLDYGERLKMGPKIAEGGQAEIFDASFEGDRRRFVLKVFKDARLEDLEHLWPPPLLPLLYVDYEPNWMLEEPNCCWIRGGTVLKDGRFAFLMDKYNCDLRSDIDGRMQKQGAERGPFDLFHVLLIMRDIARGMRSLHKRGILHRDLKASNVLVRYHFEEYVVADFETSVGIFGTGFWRAPEVLLALKTRTFKREIWTQKVDVYSYAMTCYEIMTGHIPFEDCRRNDYDFVLKGGRPQVPCWHGMRNDKPHYYYNGGNRYRDAYTYRETYTNSNHVADMRCQVRWLDKLLERCWHPDPLERPSFEEILKTIDDNFHYIVIDAS